MKKNPPNLISSKEELHPVDYLTKELKIILVRSRYLFLLLAIYKWGNNGLKTIIEKLNEQGFSFNAGDSRHDIQFLRHHELIYLIEDKKEHKFSVTEEGIDFINKHRSKIDELVIIVDKIKKLDK